jgi:type II secretory pathway component PulF
VGFDLKVPMNTRAIFWCSDYGAGLACALLASFLVVALGVRFLGGRRWWSRTINGLPLIGDLWHWSGVVEMLRGLQLLLENRVPLAEALYLAGASLTDAHLGRVCRDLGERMEKGQCLIAALESGASLPESILPLLRAGDQQGRLPEALQLAAQSLEARLRLQSSLIVALAPPLMFVLLASILGGMYVGLFVPLVQLIQGLS